MAKNVHLLNCAVQSYAWGKHGLSSEVARLSSSGNKNFSLNEDAPYAELWMGTHPKGLSMISESQMPLSSWIAENRNCLGSKVCEAFPSLQPGQLPFLLKVLSVGKSLSIQAHPDKSHAEELHRAKPDKYPDPNHKPEMAIALTPCKAMCGFRPRDEITYFLQKIQELGSIVGEARINELQGATEESAIQAALRKCFTALMTCEPSMVKDKLNSLLQRFSALGEAESIKIQKGLFMTLHSEFPGDVGCFCIYFLNVLDMEPGQAIFLEANLPHAYLKGDCIECMACSDNVVRAGLTPKFKDVDVLCSMLNYRSLPASQNLFQGHPDEADSTVTVFNPPIPDFAIAKIQVPVGNKSVTVKAVDSASILLIIEGKATFEGMTLQKGSVLFIAANETLPLDITSGGMLMFRALCLP